LSPLFSVRNHTVNFVLLIKQNPRKGFSSAKQIREGIKRQLQMNLLHPFPVLIPLLLMVKEMAG
jgi:hypothetical protein